MIEIILRTENFLVINKPAGMFVHDSNWSRMHKLGSDEPPVDCVLTALRKQLKEEFYEKTEDKEKKFKVNLHSVHRLDRMTSGCLIVALSAKWVSILQKSLQRAQKTYLTLLTKGSFDYSCLEDIETTNINILNDKDRINNNYNNNDNIIDKEIQPMFQPLSDKSSFILSYPLSVSVYQFIFIINNDQFVILNGNRKKEESRRMQNPFITSFQNLLKLLKKFIFKVTFFLSYIFILT